jgi:2-succinyl-5-enolpyruvyl-6-hydroxy-3-cyclohexene-1-carboxylate synthase
VHVNLPLRDPLVPGLPDAVALPREERAGASPGTEWPESLAGRPGGAPWTRAQPGPAAAPSLDLPWAERGVVVCGDGSYDPAPLLELAAAAGWPVLAEPSSGARRGPNALSAYPYLLACPEFLAAHPPQVVVSAGRISLSRDVIGFLRAAGAPGSAARHVVIAPGPGRWADPARSATDVAGSVRLCPPRAGGSMAGSGWLAAWQRADEAAGEAAGQVLGSADVITEPALARDLAALLPDGALLWVASSLPVRDLDHHLAARPGLRIMASRGASGIDGLVSAAMGAALAHQSAGGGPAFALLGDLALLHDLPGLILGPDEARPDLTLVVINNDGGGIFSTLEQAGLRPFERVFGTPHGAVLGHLAAAAGVPYALLERPAGLPAMLAGDGFPGPGGLRLAEARTSRAAGADLREQLRKAATAAVAATLA